MEFVNDINKTYFYNIMNELNKIEESNLLNKTFFSNENIKIIQNSIRFNIYKISNKQYIINNQNVRELKIIMRSIYLQYAKNLNNKIKDQILKLNNRVINYSIPKILTNIKQHLKYKMDLNKLPLPLLHPKNMSNKGEKSLNTFNIN